MAAAAVEAAVVAPAGAAGAGTAAEPAAADVDEDEDDEDVGADADEDEDDDDDEDDAGDEEGEGPNRGFRPRRREGTAALWIARAQLTANAAFIVSTSSLLTRRSGSTTFSRPHSRPSCCMYLRSVRPETGNYGNQVDNVSVRSFGTRKKKKIVPSSSTAGRNL